MATFRWQGNTNQSWDTDANWLGGAKPGTDGTADVQMLSGDKGTNYCTQGPTAPLTVNSLTITLATNQNAPSMLGSNGSNISVQTTFSLVEAAGTPNGNASILGAAGSRLILLSGCTGTLTAQPNGATFPYRTFWLDINAGAVLTLKALALNPAVLVGLQNIKIGTGSVIAGTLTIDPTSSDGFLISGTVTTGTINFNAASTQAHSFTVTGAGTINVNATNIFAPQSTGHWNNAGLVINVNAATTIYDVSTDLQFGDNTTINVAAPLALCNVGVAAGKTLSIVVTGEHEVVQFGRSQGTITITGTSSIATFKTTVAPASKVLSGEPRWTGATGVNVGTLPPTGVLVCK